MAYKLNGKAYTDHALMDEVIYNAKIIVNKIILKNTRLADLYETEEMMLQADYLLAINNGSMALNFFPFTVDMLMEYGYDFTQATDIMVDWKLIPVEDREDLLKFCNQYFLDHYIERNPYYRRLNGLPEDDSGEYNIYIDPRNPRLFEDDANTDFDFSKPLHEYSLKEISTLEALGIMDEVREQYKGSHYSYIEHLGPRRIDPIKARVAEQWDILYIPEVEFLVKSRFKELYATNRDIYMRKTYQDAYIYMSENFDEMVMLMITCQTLSDLINELPEWYIRRDIFDLRSVKYFLDSNGIAFFKEIPLKYQVKIVKNMNRLIRFKSTTKNVLDILEIFRAEGTTVYKYYLFKKYLYNKRDLPEKDHPVFEKPWNIKDYSFDFGEEEIDIIEYDPENGYDYDMMCEETDEIDHEGDYRNLDFCDEDSDYVPTTEETDYKENLVEKDRTIYDENGNVYQLQFVRVPIDGSYDDYIKDNIYREEYDTITRQDKYWDGEDTHYYVRNEHLRKDFTLEGTKYMFLDYSISASDYFFQMSYFLGLIFNSNIDTEDIVLSIPSINTNVDFTLTDICVLLMCLSANYSGLGLNINLPNNIKTDPKHDFYKYLEANGGWFYDGAGEDDPPPIDPDEYDGWMLPHYDFGYEDVDHIEYNELYGTIYDFGYHNTINPEDEILDYDFREITETSVPLPILPDIDRWEIISNDSGNKVTIVGSPEAIKKYLDHSKYIPEDGWKLGNWYDFGREGDSNIYDFGYENLFMLIPDTSTLPSYDGTDEDQVMSSINFSDFNFGDEDIDHIEYLDEYYQTLNAGNNCVGDGMDYDFYDETENKQFMPIYYRHRMYDFNLGDPDYVPVARPKPTVPYPWWESEDVISHRYTEYLDGRYPGRDNHGQRYNWAQGGKGVRYTEITQESYYNWMSSDNPQLFVPTAGRIYGFNIFVDIEEVKKNIGLRHSDFEFQHGYTLEDFGCEGFQSADKISNIDDLIRIYRTNSECYHNLEKHMEEHDDTRDKLVTMSYLFNSLFTVPFDLSFYRLKSGQLATSYDQILKERNFLLYKFYKEILKEPDPEVRKDMIRDILNEIVNILEFYMGTPDLKYVWSWIPTNSLQAITKYIQLMINFFKSWKVYFLDPHVTFVLDDKKENRVGMGDQIVETKINQWIGDNMIPADHVSIKINRFVSEYVGVTKEVVDIAAYHQADVTRYNNIIDGKYPQLTDEELENIGVADGGKVDELMAIPFIKADGGNVAARYDIYNLDGGGPIDHLEYLNCDGGRVNDGWDPSLPNGEENFAICDGGYVSDTLTASTTVMSFINEITYEDLSWRMGSHYDFGYEDEDNIEYNEETGRIFDYGDEIDIDDSYDINIYEFGEITDTSIEPEYSMTVRPEYDKNNALIVGAYRLDNDAILPISGNNSIKVFWDGLYLGDRFATQDRVDEIKEEMETSMPSYIDTMKALYIQVSALPDTGGVNKKVKDAFDKVMEHPTYVLDELVNKETVEESSSYTDKRIKDLIDWFNDMVPFDDWEFIVDEDKEVQIA